ncbi:MAG: hypothetical protein M1830_005325 [Pleopsidium flavum]|nr:MAG: hypothetical protein M1830_005325 [Pleopsidium flavum]
MPDGSRRSARVADLAKKSRPSAVNVINSVRASAPEPLQSLVPRVEKAEKSQHSAIKVTEPQRNSGQVSEPLRASTPAPPRRSLRLAEKAEKAQTTTIKATALPPNLPPVAARGVKPKTNAIKALEQSKRKASNVEHQLLESKRRQPSQARKAGPIQEARASNQSIPKHPHQRLLRSTLNRHALRQLEAETASYQGRARASSSSDAPQQLESETISNTISESTTQWIAASSTDEMSQALTNNSKVDVPKFATDLTRRGILEQQFAEHHKLPPKPKNLHAIESALQKRRNSPPPTVQDYIDYSEKVCDTSNESEVGMDLFYPYFGKEVRNDHKIKKNEKWKDHVPIQGPKLKTKYPKAPRPDYAEGLKVIDMPEQIEEELSGLAIPSSELAFPNFTAEMKRDGSMYLAHIQNRNNGSVASQAWHEYYTKIHSDPDKSWDFANVGSIQFNGDVVIGNVHWVSKLSGDGSQGEQRQYHMRRVFGHCITGLGTEVFAQGRQEARNFRDYFYDLREKLRRDLLVEPESLTPPELDESQLDSSLVSLAQEGSQQLESLPSEPDLNDSVNRDEGQPSKSKRPRGGGKRKSGDGKHRQAPKRNKTGASQGLDKLGL